MSDRGTIEAAPRRWERVKWSEAGQVAALGAVVTLDEDEAAMSPQAFVAAREAAGAPDMALQFLALALPRLEAIAWAAETLEACGVRSAPERVVTQVAALWLQEPDEPHRRAVWDAAAVLAGGPARFLGMAVFFSGGSIAPPHCPMVPTPEGACGTAAGAAILGACLRSEAPATAMARALATGRRVAAGPSASPIAGGAR